jgi:hypothetical protein
MRAFKIVAAAAMAFAVAMPAPVRAAPPPNITNTVGVCDPNAPTHCAAPDASGNFPVTGTITASLGSFTPNGTGQTISATTSSSSTAVVGGPSFVVVNNGASPVYVTFSTGAGTATTAGYYIPAGWGANLNAGASANHINLIATGGTTTVTISPGAGLATITSGSGTSSISTVSINQATPGTTNGVVVNAGSAVIGHVITDTGSTTAVTGSVAITAAALPLPTNAAQETGGNLATIAGAIGSPIPAGTNVIGSIANTSFGISGTLPAFASTPTVNCGTGCFQTTQPVSGTFFQVTQPVSGTFFQATQPVSNAGTFAVQAQPTPVTSGGLSTFSEIVPANTPTSVAGKAGAGEV